MNVASRSRPPAPTPSRRPATPGPRPSSTGPRALFAANIASQIPGEPEDAPGRDGHRRGHSTTMTDTAPRESPKSLGRPGHQDPPPRRPPARQGVTFQRAKAWKEPTDPDHDHDTDHDTELDHDTDLDRVEHVLARFPDRTFTFDESKPPGIRPTTGNCRGGRSKPDRLPANDAPRTWSQVRAADPDHGMRRIRAVHCQGPRAGQRIAGAVPAVDHGGADRRGQAARALCRPDNRPGTVDGPAGRERPRGRAWRFEMAGRKEDREIRRCRRETQRQVALPLQTTRVSREDEVRGGGGHSQSEVPGRIGEGEVVAAGLRTDPGIGRRDMVVRRRER